jgi:CheY-like chemotaxis protein
MAHNLLIVEDNPDLRSDLVRTVSSYFARFEILTAKNETEALQHINSLNFLAVITDINLIEGGGTEMGGLEVIGAIAEKNPEIPIVVVTAYGRKIIEYENSTLSLEAFSTRLGAIKVITRPDPNDDYLDILAKTLEGVIAIR